MARKEIRRDFLIKQGKGTRRVVYRAYDQISVEDCMTMLIGAHLHRYKTGEDVVPAIPRDIKDALLKQNVVI